MAYLDLSEIDDALQQCSLLKRRFGPANFRASDHAVALENVQHETLDESVRELVTQRTGKRPDGPIRMLTLLRSWGYYFSPLNVYFCFESERLDSETTHVYESADEHKREVAGHNRMGREAGASGWALNEAAVGRANEQKVHEQKANELADDCVPQLKAMVAEVSNTPWRETNYYVVDELATGKRGTLTSSHEKTFHVSPFMDMDSRYEWHLSTPSENLDLKLISHNPKHPFVADMHLKRRPLTNRSLTRLLLRHPCMSGQILTRIYYQALKLWWKRCPFYSHPKHSSRNLEGQFTSQ